MRRRAATRRHVHIDEAKRPAVVFPAYKNGVGIANDSDVKKFLGQVRLCNRGGAVQVVCGADHALYIKR